MATTRDSISVFAEGTFDEQIQELVNYIARSRPEDQRASLITTFQDALKPEGSQKAISEDIERQQKVLGLVLSEVKGLGDGNEKEIEGFFNLLYAHLLTVYSIDSPELSQRLGTLVTTIGSAPESTAIKYRILSNLFNSIPQKSPLRLVVYTTLLNTAISHDELDHLQPTKANIEKWLNEWEITPEQKASLLKHIIDQYEKDGQPAQAYDYRIILVRQLPSNSSLSQSASAELISAALKLPAILDFDPLYKLTPIISLGTIQPPHELFTLLQIFRNDSSNLSELEAWEVSHPGALEKHGLEKQQLERKLRLLTLSSLAFQHVGQDLPYAKVSEALQVPITDVEKWVIDVIRAGLLSGKLSQTNQTLHITRATARRFEKVEWEALERRLVAWKAGIASVLDVIGNARRQVGVTHVSAQTQTVA